MRKIFLILGAVLSGAYTLLYMGMLLGILPNEQLHMRGGLADLAASIVPLAIGAAFCLSCIAALRRKKPDDPPSPQK